MRKPRFPINTPAKVTQAREYLGMNKAELARALRYERVDARDTVHRWEQGLAKAIPGPVQVALEGLVEKRSAKP